MKIGRNLQYIDGIVVSGVIVHPWVASPVRIAGDAKGYYIAISSTHLRTVNGGMPV
jgi:hypothetical protein